VLEHHCDVTEVTDRNGAVADFDRCGRFPLGFDAVEEVAMVIITLVKVDFIRAD